MKAVIQLATEVRCPCCGREIIVVVEANLTQGSVTGFVIKKSSHDTDDICAKDLKTRELARELFELLKETINKRGGGVIRKDEFIELAVKKGFTKEFVEACLDRWLKEGMIYTPKPNLIGIA